MDDHGPDLWEHGDGDTSICPDCGEIKDDANRHPECCDHEEVEVDDARDGVGGRIRCWCQVCGEEVRPEPNEDGGIDWSPIY